jgi:pyruvate kinase
MDSDLHPIARTCIIATLGPASSDPGSIAALIQAGANVFRLNFSHGDHETHARTFGHIREQAARVNRPIGILQDLQGPKIRIRRFETGSVELTPGAEFRLSCDDETPGDQHRVGVTYSGLCADVAPGSMLLLDDGRRSLEVVKVEGQTIVTRVVVGGTLSDRKGINVPGADLKIPALSDKDVEDLSFGTNLGVDWVAISFVRSPEDIQLARDYMDRNGSTARLMAKIEKPSAVARFDAILEVADGVMVARGDLGVEMSPEQVPIIQKRLITLCREAGKPVVTATQMLESMIASPMPTRAEASDVANAIFDGTDAVMLSAETASGDYPVESVTIMNRIALSVEADPGYLSAMAEKMVHVERTVFDSVAYNACQMAREIGARVIVTFSASGATALRVARHRVDTHVLAITPNETAYRQLAMSWGIKAVLAEDIQNTDQMVSEANRCILESGVANPGDLYLITAGVPFGVSGTTNLIRAEVVQDEDE